MTDTSSDTQRAFDAARTEILRVREAGENRLDLTDEDYNALTTLPEEIGSLTDVNYIDLDNTKITDLSPLNPLAKTLTRLDLGNTPVSDLQPLANLTALTTLYLNDTQIADLQPLANLTALTALHLNRTPTADLQPLANLTALNALYLSETQTTDLQPLANLTFLTALNLNDTQTTDLRPLLPHLTRKDAPLRVTFEHTPATEVSPDLARLAEMDTDMDRTGELAAFLQKLPPYPEPLRWEDSETGGNGKADTENITLQIKQELDRLSESLARNENASNEKRVDELKQDVERLFQLVTSAEASVTDISEKLQSLQETEQNQTKALAGLSSSVKDFTTTVNEFDTRLEALGDEYEAKMAAAEEAFRGEQAIKAPVELWSTKQEEHETNRDRAFKLFCASLVAITASVIGIVYALNASPTAATALLAPLGCDTAKPETCQGFGLKGLITTASVLTVLTVFLWFTRLQMKLYLAERHLVLDARERRAFAQTYVSLLNEGDTSKEAQEQRALVYTALFRPSSDGIVSEEGGLDPAITAAISKILSR